MKRYVNAILMIIALPILIVGILYFVNAKAQPEILSLASDTAALSTSYLESDKFYEIAGKMASFPGVNIVPSSYNSRNFDGTQESSLSYIAGKRQGYTTISSLSEIRNEEYIVNGKYTATICFFLSLPSFESYALWFPAEFCEYNVYINGELMAESYFYRQPISAYAAPFYVDLPASEDGTYEIWINISTPVGYINTGSDAIILGYRERIESSFSNVMTSGLFFINLMLFTIIYSLIQTIMLKPDKRVVSFSLLSVMTIFTMSFMDGRLVSSLIPALPYQIGVVFESISMPLYLIALLMYTDSMFPDYIPRKHKIAAYLILLFPILNSLMLKSVPVMNSISIIITIVPYAICLYVFVAAYEAAAENVTAYGIGLLSIESSVLLYYSTKDMSIPSRFTYGIGYLIFAITMVSIIARDFAKQNRDEEFYKAELSRQLETMQASENAFLNSQMKPHFLYNTLNTIADLCVTDPAKAKSLINSLSEYLKLILSMDSMDETVPLRRELEVVEAYTAIEHERFPSINFYNEFPVRLPAIMMPPLTIQPLIENAIKHGVRKSSKPGIITLRIKESETEVTFFVSDNGVGMNEEAIAKLFKVPTGNQSIGIYNIDKRLKSKYGRGLMVESTPNLGTCVSFTISKLV